MNNTTLNQKLQREQLWESKVQRRRRNYQRNGFTSQNRSNLQARINRVRALSSDCNSKEVDNLKPFKSSNLKLKIKRHRMRTQKDMGVTTFDSNIMKTPMKSSIMKQAHLLFIETTRKKVMNIKTSRFKWLASPNKLSSKLKKSAHWFKSMSPLERRHFVFSPLRKNDYRDIKENSRYEDQPLKSPKNPIWKLSNNINNMDFFTIDSMREHFVAHSHL